MKIVCDACQAKYSISDDKVQGKVFKIRCKKCSNIIVVRGGAGAAEAPPAQEKDTRVYDYGADAGGGGGGDESVWHVVINQDQVGPMTAAEVQQRFAAGEIDGETYAWREGFADWLPLSQVDAFASYVASGSTTAAVSNGGGGGAAAVSAMFGGGEEAGTVRSDPGDLFSAASASSSRGGDDDGDLFGSKPSSSKDAQSAANAKLRGERNENSVLFSLNNLAQLASDKPAPSAGSTSSVPSGHASGAAGGEGSGLIDIRSMANAYLGNTGGGAGNARPAASIGSIDDLPVFGGGGFSEPAVIVPTAGRQNNNKMMYVLIGSVGFLAVAAVIMVVVLLKGGNNNNNNNGNNNQVANNDKGSDTKGGDEAKTPDTKGSDEAKTPDTKGSDGSAANPETATKTPENPETKTPETKTPETKTPETKTPETKKPDTKKPDTKKPDTKRPQIAANTTPKPDTKKPVEAPLPKEPAGGGGCDEVSCVLNNYEGACCAKFKKGGATKPAGGNTAKPAGGGASDLPEGLDRTMIQDGVNKVKARVMGCGDKSSAKGQVKVSVKVTPAGSVASVSVKSSPDAALGSCVSAAMSKASFGKTQNGGSFAYPWNF